MLGNLLQTMVLHQSGEKITEPKVKRGGSSRGQTWKQYFWYTSVCKTLFSMSVKWNSLFREDADWNLTNAASPAVPAHFPKQSFGIYEAKSTCNQSLLLCSKCFWTDSSLQLPKDYSIPNPVFIAQHQRQQQKVQKAQDVSVACLAGISHLRAAYCSGTWCLPPQHQLTLFVPVLWVPDLSQTPFPGISQPPVSVSCVRSSCSAWGPRVPGLSKGASGTWGRAVGEQELWCFGLRTSRELRTSTHTLLGNRSCDVLGLEPAESWEPAHTHCWRPQQPEAWRASRNV